MFVEPFPDAPDQQGHISPLPPPVGMQLVQDQKPKPFGVLPHRFIGLYEPRHEQLEHDVVRQEDIGGILRNVLPLFVRFLAGIAGKGHRLVARSIAALQKLLQLFKLAVAQGIHRIDDDGTDALAGVAGLLPLQYIIDNGDEVTERFAGSCPRRQDIALASSGDSHGFGLVFVQHERLAEGVGWVLDAKNFRAFRVESAVCHKLFNRPTRHEIGVQLDEGSRPETATGISLINSLANVCRPDTAEAAREAFVF